MSYYLVSTGLVENINKKKLFFLGRWCVKFDKNDFLNKSRHHSKLVKFIYPELIEIKDSNILEFGVSEKAMSTELFLEYSNLNNCNKIYKMDQGRIEKIN